MPGASVNVTDLTKVYADHQALKGVSLSVEAGSYTVILGPSGSGKTTLLAILGGFADPTSGQIRVGGHDVTRIAPAKRPTTTVFQDYALFPHMTVGKNVGFGLAMRGISGAERTQKINEALELVGLAHTAKRHIAELSGGQRQRIALARALVVEPPVLLLDEPLGALDLKLRRSMQDELRSIQRELGTTFIHVTHDQEEAMSLADTVVVLRDGVIDDMGSPERLYMAPKTSFTARFLGDSNVVTGTIQAQTGDTATVATGIGEISVRGNVKTGSPVTVSIRPEHLKVNTKQGHSLGSFTIVESDFLGMHHRLILHRDGHRVLVYVPPGDLYTVGGDVTLSLPPNTAVIVEGSLDE
jgi:spermidine/putrescine transport system ATP-binding protein